MKASIQQSPKYTHDFSILQHPHVSFCGGQDVDSAPDFAESEGIDDGRILFCKTVGSGQKPRTGGSGESGGKFDDGFNGRTAFGREAVGEGRSSSASGGCVDNDRTLIIV